MALHAGDKHLHWIPCLYDWFHLFLFDSFVQIILIYLILCDVPIIVLNVVVIYLTLSLNKWEKRKNSITIICPTWSHEALTIQRLGKRPIPIERRSSKAWIDIFSYVEDILSINRKNLDNLDDNDSLMLVTIHIVKNMINLNQLTGRSFDSRTASVIAWVLNFIT